MAQEKTRGKDAGRQSGGEALKRNLTRGETWIRLLYMLLFVAIYWVAKVVLGAVVIFQFGTVLLTRETNSRLLAFGRQLATFIYEVALFLTYNTEDKPFPFASWPGDGAKPPARRK